MVFHDTLRPIDKGITKTVLIALAIIIVAVGVAIFALSTILSSVDVEPVVYGLVVIWVGSLAFFYAVITEEHTMKEIFLRQGYFFTGLVAMIFGVFFISLAGLSSPIGDVSLVEFGLLLLVGGAVLVLLSAKKARDYSKRSGFIAIFGSIMLIIGGVMAGSINVSYAGIFILIFSAVWLGLRSKWAI